MVLISPSKTMDTNNLSNHKITTCNLKTTKEIVKVFANMDKDTLANTLTIKGKTLDAAYNYYQSWGDNTKKALQLYTGVSFSQINYQHPDYIKDHIYILSALYGLVNGEDYIAPYRLDFLYKNLSELKLYDIWKPLITKAINKINPSYIIDACSQEFSKLLDGNNINANIYQLNIISETKPSSVLLKQVRGQLVNSAIELKITKIKDFSKIKIDNINKVEIDHKQLQLNIYLS